jgi:nitrile hydratase beta subunit
MDGIHDLGGRQGYGPVDVGEPDEPFHHEWEARLLGIVRSYTRVVPFSIDWFRFTRESIEPDEYLIRPYYDQWLTTHEVMGINAGVFTVEEVATGKSSKSIAGTPPPMAPDKVGGLTRSMSRYDRPSDTKPAFVQGDAVTTISKGAVGHTRLPQYARGRTGRIEAFRGFHILPDTNMAGDGPAAPLYCVSFLAADLWAEAAGRSDRVYLDLWETYFERT